MPARDLPHQSLFDAYRHLDSLSPDSEPERYAQALADVERARIELGDRLWNELTPARRQDISRRIEVLRQYSGESFSWSSTEPDLEEGPLPE